MNQFQTFGEVAAALRRRAWVILFVTALGCLASVYIALQQVKTYRATAVVQIEDARVSDSVAGAVSTTNNATRRLRLIEQRLMSRDNLLRIMDKHALFLDNPDRTLNERIFMMREAAELEEIVNASPVFTPGGNMPSGLMISVQLNDPEKAAAVANELMASVIDQSRNRSASAGRETLDFFDTEEDRVSAEIEALEARIATFKRENAAQLPAGAADLRAQMLGLREADLELDREIIALEADTGRQRADVTERQVALLQEQKALIAERIRRIEALIDVAPEVERALNGLEREMDRLQEQYGVITRRKAEAEMGQALQDREATDRFEILETALVPEVPTSSSRKKLAMMGGVASLIAGISVAFLLELMNPAIRNVQQMERALGFQPIVAIPTVSTRRDRYMGGMRLVAKALAGLAVLGLGVAVLWNKAPALAEWAGRLLPWRAA